VSNYHYPKVDLELQRLPSSSQKTRTALRFLLYCGAAEVGNRPRHLAQWKMPTPNFQMSHDFGSKEQEMSTSPPKAPATKRIQSEKAFLPDDTAERKVAKSRASTTLRLTKIMPPKPTSVWSKRDAPTRLGTEDFVSLFRKDPFEHVRLVKHGVPASLVELLAAGMGVSKDKLLATLGLPRATIQRKAKINGSLSVEESSRVLGISRLIGQTQAMIEASGNPDHFDAGSWVAQWLDQPLPALGGRRPAELMDTAEGQAIVSNILSHAQSSAYA
jgi:putative toxin-antitoxin system antitoxin component (TIGR02293 family)